MQRGQKGYEDSLREREMRSLPMKKIFKSTFFFIKKKNRLHGILVVHVAS